MNWSESAVLESAKRNKRKFDTTSIDATVWAREFVKVLKQHPDINKHTDKLSRDSIILYCKKYLDKAISKKSIAKSKYLTEDMLGKTYRKIGFWFEPV